MVEVIPAIMPKSLEDLEYKAGLVKNFVKTVQVDVMDGIFVKPKNWPFAGEIKDFQKLVNEEYGMPFWKELDYEADLMVSNPGKSVSDWISAGARRIVIHFESVENLGELLDSIYERHKSGNPCEIFPEIGISLNTDTECDDVIPYTGKIDFVQLMGIKNIGYQGQRFDENVIDKVASLHKTAPGIIISVDGGVDFDNASALVSAGARRLVSGSAIFGSDNIREAIEGLKNS